MSTTENIDEVINELYEKYHIMVKRMSLRYSDNNNELAEDAVQHSYLALYEVLKAGEKEIRCMRTFLLSISKNYTLDQVRNRKKETLSDIIVEYSDNVQFSKGPDEIYMDKITDQKLALALDKIREKNEVWHHIATEIFINDTSQVELAKELEISKEAVYALVYRLKRWANKNMSDFKE